jgi:hypothetical protein
LNSAFPKVSLDAQNRYVPFLSSQTGKAKLPELIIYTSFSALGAGYGQTELTQFGTITAELTIESSEVFQEIYGCRKLSCHVNVTNEHLSTQ